MKNFLVTFYCSKDSYDGVVNAIKKGRFWARINPYAWIVQSDGNTVEIRDQIKKDAPGVDKLLVIGIDNANWATSLVSKEVTNWMKENI